MADLFQRDCQRYVTRILKLKDYRITKGDLRRLFFHLFETDFGMLVFSNHDVYGQNDSSPYVQLERIRQLRTNIIEQEINRHRITRAIEQQCQQIIFLVASTG